MNFADAKKLKPGDKVLYTHNMWSERVKRTVTKKTVVTVMNTPDVLEQTVWSNLLFPSGEVHICVPQRSIKAVRNDSAL